MELKNKEIKKLFDSISLYFDMVSLPSVVTSFMACDDAIEGEIAALKAELHDANVSKDIFSTNADHLRSVVLERGDELRKANNQIASLKEDLKTADEALEAENSRLRLLEHSRITWRARAQHAEKEVEDLNKKISDLERKLTEQLEGSVTYQLISDLRKENKKLKDENIELNEQHDEDILAYEELDEKYQAAEHEIKVLKTLLGKERKAKEALMEQLGEPEDLKFGDIVHVSWNDDDYMYIEEQGSHIRLYNITGKRLIYVAKHEHLTKTGEASFIPVG